MNLHRKSTHQEFAATLAKCRPEDFDGRTAFQDLTPEQRLEWLCQAAAFVYEFKGSAQRIGEGKGVKNRGTGGVLE